MRQARISQIKPGQSQSIDEDESPVSSGMSRTLMTFGIIFILGFAVAFILMELTANTRPFDTSEVISLLGSSCNACGNSSNPEVANAVRNATLQIVKSHNDAADEINKSMTDMAKSVLTVLGGAVSSIVGFYFATRTTEGSLDKAKQLLKQQQGNSGDLGSPKIEISPTEGGRGTGAELKVKGSGFAKNSEITLTFSKTDNANIAITLKPTTDDRGAFNSTFKIDPPGDPGDYHVKAVDEKGNKALAEYKAT